jgi:O-antigen/teichoic acid export membrane protein
LAGLAFMLFVPQYVSIANALILVFVSFALKYAFSRYLSRKDYVRLEITEFKDVLSYSLKSFWGNVIQKYNVRLDILILAFFATSEDIGVYSILVMYSQVQWVLVDGITTYFGPGLIDEKDDINRMKSVKKMSLFIIWISASVAICQWALSYTLFDKLFGIEIAPYVHHLAVLLMASMIFSLVKILTKYFSAIGLPEINSHSAFVSFLSTISVGLYLMTGGILGASYASLISYTIGMSYLLYRMNRL